jgi:large subunit ribosomal protein L3
MGKHGPKRGTRALRPRGRAKSIVPGVRAWPSLDKGVAGFAGYKVGMAHALVTADRGPWKGQEVSTPVTIVETPPIFIYGIRGYEQTPYGLKTVAEVQVPPSKDAFFERIATPAKKAGDVAKLESMVNGLKELHVLALTRPSKAGVGNKTPQAFELALGGDAKAQLEFAKSILGKDIRVSDVLAPGESIDVIAVTKGKGWQGVVKRFGVALQPRKATQRRRHGGSIGPETQATVMYTVPRAGQMGFHKRTEGNKRILAIGTKPSELSVKGGWPHYGEMRNDFLVVEGSLAGPANRFLRLRKAVDKPPVRKPELKMIILSRTQQVKLAG